MKNSYIRKLTLTVIITIISVAGSVLTVAYSLSYRALADDMRIRTEGVSAHIAEGITLTDIRSIDGATNKLDAIRNELQRYISIENLYLAKLNGNGELISTHDLPSNKLLNDLTTAIEEKKLKTSPSVRNTKDGAMFGSYWPVLNTDGDIEGIICMEYSADSIAKAHKNMLLYSITISLFFLIFIAFTARLIMSKTSDDFYKKLAYTDILTGYDNRMAFEIELIKAEKQAKTGTPTAIMVFDLNNLKAVNDALGHKEGDTLIKNTADIINSHIKQHGKLYRVGGDEFATILTDLSWPELQTMINEIHTEKKEVLANHPFSCAAGMSRFDRTSDQSLTEIFKRADDAMYENKRLTKSKTLKIDEREKSNIELLREAAHSQRQD